MMSTMDAANTSPVQRRVYLETYGCQMNIADSQTVTAILRRAGYLTTDDAGEADIILLNTCAIREHAEERVLGRLSDLARLKSARPQRKLGLLGCMAQHNRAELIKRAPWLDLVAGPDSYRRLPEMLASAAFDPAVDVRLDRTETYADVSPEYGNGVRAYITAMRGCDKFCAFCVVPYVRGRERSVPADDILRQVHQLEASGVKEIVLLGQTVNAYRDEQIGFGQLLRMVAAVDGIERIRFTSPHPGDMTQDVIDAMAQEPKVQPYLHLPVQSGSDRILTAMSRGYTTDDYLRLVEGLRSAIPDLALSTDIIVGFQGEDDDDFAATLRLMRAVAYDSAFMFKYSVREHTRAFKLGDTVSDDEKSRRLTEVIALQEAISLERNRALIGREFEVLVEGPARRGHAMLVGKTPQFKTALFPEAPSIHPGDTVRVCIHSATGHSLIARLVASPDGRSNIIGATHKSRRYDENMAEGDGRRPERVAEMVLRELSQLLLRDLRDPRLRGVTLTRVKMSDDLRHGSVFFSHLEGQVHARESINGFRSASGFIRRQIGQALQLRYTPQLDFEFDPGPENAARVDELLRANRPKEQN
jgi:tRNA-2-methylthio-N6-dimethylallyladenosine synthase